MSIKQSILNEAQKEVDQILSDAKEAYNQILEKSKENTLTKVAHLKENTIKEQQRIINEKKLELENDVKRLVLEEKNKQIDRVLEKFKNHLLSLDDKAFFDYVVKRILTEQASGNEVMRVNKADYNKYLSLFSSSKKGKKVELDILNKALGSTYKLTLSDEDAKLDDGFLLVGDIFDLNFSVTPLIEKIKRTTEKQIHDILYK